MHFGLQLGRTMVNNKMKNFLKKICLLLIIVFLLNGCASFSKKTQCVQNHSVNNLTNSEMVNYGEDTEKYESGKEAAMQVLSLLALPLIIPILFIAALFSGVS